jgi:penicillin amidase
MKRRTSFFCGSLVAVLVAVACGDEHVPNPLSFNDAAPPEASAPPVEAGPDAPEQPFPPVTGTVNVSGLTGSVDVLRDTYGVIHIYAANAADAFRVQGYQVARDRTVQLELLRRSATGRLAEVFGGLSPDIVDSDIAMRAVGLGRVAKAMYDALPANSDLRAWIDAYADGITQFNARVVAGQEHFPASMVLLPPDAFAPWTGADILAVGRLQSFNLGYQGDDEIAFTETVTAARAKLGAGATDPALQKRGGLLVDLVRFAPIDPTTVMDGFPNDTNLNQMPIPFARVGPSKVTTPNVVPEALAATRAFRDAIGKVRSLLGDKHFTGSNNWVVGPALTATGHPMVASDPHLSLSAPAVFWMVHVNVSDPKAPLDFEGLSFPGIPSIILGFNRNLAWGATTADYDVTDVYTETLTADGKGVVFKGQNVPFQNVTETIKIAGGGSYDYVVPIVPHHGPIVPTIVNHTVAPPTGTQLSIRWTGHQPTHELDAVASLVKATNVEDARTAMRNFEVGAQNWVFGDTQGNIFYTTQSDIPKRDKASYTWDPKTFSGTLPCMALPGDGTAEWTGKYLEESYIPHVKNPQKGYVGTANGDQVGVTLDNDPSNDKLPSGEPMYLACFHDPGFRVGRVHKRIESRSAPLTLDAMADIQADARSAMGSELTAQILATIAHAEEEKTTPGTHPDISALVASARYSSSKIAPVKAALTSWGTDSDYDANVGVSLDDGSLVTDPKQATASVATSIFNAWMVRMFDATLGDEVKALGVGFDYDPRRALLNLMLPTPSSLATYDATLKDSILFDDLGTTGVTETRDERVLTSLLDALDYLDTALGPDANAWRWGKLHRIRFNALISLWPALSIPPDGDKKWPNGFPRHGDGYNIDVGEYAVGAPLASTSFDYHHGPTQRFVIDMDPAGPVAKNALPGGEVWDPDNKHFADEAERWRRNQNRPMPFSRADIIAAAEEHVVYSSK